MKKIIWILFAVLVMGSANLQAKDAKIGVIDFARVMEESPQAEKARREIMDEFAPREKELRELSDSIRSKEERFTRDSAVMSASERDRLERDLVSDKRDFKRKQDQFREDVNFKQNELVGGLQRKLVGNIREYAKKNGFDILIADGVIYAADAFNVTEQVLEHLRKSAK
ncbi:MAG: OmpH family outer membrane protein [Gammaproteobacteria bacterium]|nr:OmpH family outer membrane protein [Gammaproteobacteria bacterium]